MKKLIIAILLLAIAGLSFYTYNYLYIVDGVDLDRENIVKKVSFDEFIVIEYPDNFDEKTTADFRGYAEELMHEIVADNSSEERLIVDKKIESIQYNNVLVLDDRKSYDLDNHKFIDDFDISEKLKKIFSGDLRYQMKKDKVEEVYTTEIAKTYYKNIKDYRVSLDSDNIRIEYQDYHFEYPLINYADTLNYDLGIEVVENKHQVKRYVNPDRKLVCLTYDDGPDYNDLELLEILEKYDSKATFFQLGKSIGIGERSKITLALIESGNLIGNHSFSHEKPNLKTLHGFKQEMKGYEDKISEITNGTYKTKYFRPPYGYVNDIIRENSDYPLILWNIDTLDWKTHDKDSTVKEIKDNVFDGAIILMHSIRPSSVEATDEIIPYLIDEGYEIVTIEEMFEIRGTEQIPGEKYRFIE